jgi:hypothetical protein
MLIHERFVFLHVPKTGGRFIRHVLGQEISQCRELPIESRHDGWDKIPKEAAGLPVLGFVRNPWDWYVSWYSFIVEGMVQVPPIHELLFTVEQTRGARTPGDFRTAVRQACTGIVDSGNRAELERAVQGFDLAEPLMEGHDFYTSRLMVTYGAGLHSDQLTIGRLESLADDLEAFLHQAGVEMDDGAIERIRTTKAHGASRRGPYPDYYDDELRDLVGSSCEAMIERFGYSFGT